MKPLLKSNIKKSLSVLEDRKQSVPDDQVVFAGDKPKAAHGALAVIFAREPHERIPWFYRDEEGELRSPQAPFFGVYAVRSILRGYLLSIPFVHAANRLGRDPLSACVVLYSTAA